MYSKLHNRQYLLEARKILRIRETPQESKLWELVKSKKLGPKFRRQHSIGQYIVDFYCASKGLIIEIDGYSHFNKEQQIFDGRRTLFLKELGFTVIRFTNSEVDSNISAVLEKIRTYINTTTFPFPD